MNYDMKGMLAFCPSPSGILVVSLSVLLCVRCDGMLLACGAMYSGGGGGSCGMLCRVVGTCLAGKG